MTPSNLIAAEAVTFRRRHRAILSEFNLRLRTGELTVIVGPNGAGKSTLLRLLTGDLTASSGTIGFAGRDITAWRPGELARRRAVLSQSTQLVFPFTVAEVVELGLERAHAGGRGKVVADALAQLDLEGFSGRLMQELSGGEQQRVHLARVLCQLRSRAGTEALYLFLDEPTSSLDIRHQIRVLDTIRSWISARLGALVILHDLNLAAAYADRLIILEDGRIAVDGPPRLVMTEALLSRVYGVDLEIAESDNSVSIRPRGLGRIRHQAGVISAV